MKSIQQQQIDATKDYDNAKQKLDNLKEQEKQAQLNIEQVQRQRREILRKHLDELQAKERLQRSNVYSIEAKKYIELHKQFEKISTDELFQTAFKKLKELYEEYKNLLRKLELAYQHLQQNLPAMQLHKFLANKLLKDNPISGIGPNRQSILATHGIETAADIEESKISGIKGFGKQLTNILLNWRKSMEQEFVFDPTPGIDPADTAVINQRFFPQLKLIEDQLLSGPEQLDKIKTQILQRRPQLLNELKQAVLKVAQAKADLSIF